MKQYFLFLCIVLMIVSAVAQPTIHTILQSEVNKDERTGIASAFVKETGPLEFNLPLLESIDLRTELDRMMPSRQNFKMRANLNSARQNFAENKRYKAMVNLKGIKFDRMQKQFISAKYQQVLDAIDADYRKVLYDELLRHYLKLDEIYRLELTSGVSVNLANYMKNKEDILDIKNKRLVVDQKRFLTYSGLNLDTAAAINFSDLILPQQMNSQVVLLVFKPEQNQESREMNAELAYLDTKINIRRAERSKMLDFVQVGYTVREDLLSKNKFSVSLGLTVPYKGSTNIALKELHILKSEMLNEKTVSNLNLREEFEKLKHEFNMIYASYQISESLYNSDEYKRLKETLRNSGRISVIEIEEMDKSEIENKLNQWKNYFELLSCYIKLMDFTEELSNQPLRNHLNVMKPAL